MLKIIDAYKFAFAEMQKKPNFWAGLMLVFIIVSSFATKGSELWIGVLILLLGQIGIINVGFLVVNNKTYGLKDLVVKPYIYLRLCAAGIFIAIYIISVSVIITFSIDQFFVIFRISSIMMPVFIENLMWVISHIMIYLFAARFIFTPFYIMDKGLGIIESIIKSWRKANIKVSLSILGVFAIYVPFYMLQEMSNTFIHISSITIPIQYLGLIHIYIHHTNIKENEIKNIEELDKEQLKVKKAIKWVYITIIPFVLVVAISIIDYCMKS